MASGEKVTLCAGKGIYFDRQLSVNDEDLFGAGRMHQEHQTHTDIGTPENVNNEEKNDRVDHGNIADVGDENRSDVDDAEGIPNFELLCLSSSADTDSSSSPKPFEVKDENVEARSETFIETKRHSLIEDHSEQDSEFKIRFQGGRSISANDRRKKYRVSSGGEVFDDTIDSVEEEYQVRVHVRKSNSLPDLVTCSSQSPLSPPRYNSNPSQQCEVTEHLEKQYETKKKVEGNSTMPTSNGKPKIKRTVSIKEEPEYIPSDTPTKDRRRIRSSGYVTGSSEAGSQDKEVGTSRQISQNSQGSSGVWTSQESVEKTGTVVETNAVVSELPLQPPLHMLYASTHSSGSTLRQNVSPLSSGSGFNDSGSLGSSVNTILDAKTHEVVRKKTCEREVNQFQREVNIERSKDVGSCEIPNLSIMDGMNRSQYPSPSFEGLRIDDENKDDKGIRSNGKKSAELKQGEVFQLKTPDSIDPQSCGNLPNFSTLESFSLKGSSLVKVQEEDIKDHLIVKQMYCGDVRPYVGQNVADSYAVPIRGQSLSSQLSPPEVVKRLEEILMKIDDSASPSIIEYINQALRGPDSLTSPQSHERERNDSSPGAQTLKDVTLEDLERASRCNFPACKENCCLKMHELYRVLKDEIPDLDPMYRLVKSYYMALHQHSENGCEETKCPVLFCSEFLEWETYTSADPLKHLVNEIQNYFRNPTMKLFLQSSFKFHKLQNRMPKLDVKVFETHTPMFALGKFGTAQVCMENRSQKLVVLKMYPLMEYDHQLSLYTRLKDLDHPNSVPQLWMLEYDDRIQVCSLFAQGGSLEDYLNDIGGHLPWSRVVRYMKQILSAVCHLHTRGVVYFNWSSGNMLFPDDRHYTVQVGNFSLSCPVGSQWDIGAVKECLPYNICPPELFDRNYTVDFKSDVWGAGCMFYEMLTGTPVLHHLRHEDRKTVHTQIKNVSVRALSDTESLSKEKTVILDSCWQIKMEDRQKMEDILKYIESLRVK